MEDMVALGASDAVRAGFDTVGLAENFGRLKAAIETLEARVAALEVREHVREMDI